MEELKEIVKDLFEDLEMKNISSDLRGVCGRVGITQQGNKNVLSARLAAYILTTTEERDPIFRRLTLCSETERKIEVFRTKNSSLKSRDIEEIALKGSKTFGRRGTGRKKIEIKYVENDKKRTSIFSKRKKGIMKKFGELGILTGCNFLVVLKSPGGRISSECSDEFEPYSREIRNIIRKK